MVILYFSVEVLFRTSISINSSHQVEEEGKKEEEERGEHMVGRRRKGMADFWWKDKDIRKRARIAAEVDFWWREVDELQPSRSLQETTQPFTYLKTIKMT